MVLDMGQWLSIPFILAGIALLVYAYKKKIPAKRIEPEKTNYRPLPKEQRESQIKEAQKKKVKR
jgi:prolipoprotein diacylglyceryltransferase